jgi:uncharacterized protein YjbI with pentapeptide repeats
LVWHHNNNKDETVNRGKFFYEDYMDKIIHMSILLPKLPQAKIEEFVTGLSNDEDISQCASIFGEGLSPNPRRIKRILRTFLFIRDMSIIGIKEGYIKPSLLAKLIVIQSQLPNIFELIAGRPSLLKDLEKYYRIQAKVKSEINSSIQIQTEKEDSALHEQAEKYAVEHPELRRILIKEINEDDTFINTDIGYYIALVGALAEVRPQEEHDIFIDSQREVLLQAYLDRISELLLTKHLRESPEDEVRNVAKAQTLTVLKRLDGVRKGSLIRFLYESGLISIIDLSKADLRQADLHEVDLSNANLDMADLQEANLSNAKLDGVNLHGANLTNADLRGAILPRATLREADLRGALLDGASLTKEQWLSEGNALADLKRYEEAIAAYDQALRLNPNDAAVYTSKGIALANLKRYEEAIAAYDQAHRLNPNDVIAYTSKGGALIFLERYEEAIAACDQALSRDSNDALAYYNKGVALERLGRELEAQQAYERARQLGLSVSSAIEIPVSRNEARRKTAEAINQYVLLQSLNAASSQRNRVINRMRELAPVVRYSWEEIARYLLSLNEGERFAALASVQWQWQNHEVHKAMNFSYLKEIPPPPRAVYKRIEL